MVICPGAGHIVTAFKLTGLHYFRHFSVLKFTLIVFHACVCSCFMLKILAYFDKIREVKPKIVFGFRMLKPVSLVRS